MSDWKECRLGEHVLINHRSIDENYPYKEIEYLDTSSITRGRIDSLQHLTLADAPSRAKRIVRDNDIVLSMVRPIQRHYGYLRKTEPNTVASTGFIVLTSQESIDSYFLYLFLTQDDITEYLDVVAEGSTSAYPAFTPDVVESLPVRLPPIPEQRAIAGVLSSLDDKIDLLHRQNKTLEEIAEALWRKMFVEEVDPGQKKEKLGDVVKIIYGKNLPTSELTESGYPVFGANGQIGYCQEYLYASPQVLISCRGEASGKVNFSCSFAFITNNSLVLEIPINSVLKYEFLKYWALHTDFTLYVTGSAQPQITIEELKMAEIDMPSEKKISHFCAIVATYEDKRIHNDKQIANLVKLRDTLLPRLMSGQVRVRI